MLADSENTRLDLIELLDVPANKISVVPPGVGPEFRPVRDTVQLNAVRERYHLPQWFILFVGTIEPRKNLARLIAAYGQLRQTGLPHALVLAGGQGWLSQGIYEQVASEGLSEHVLFPGFVADEHLPALYTLADVFAFPSLYEGFGIPPLEAMACGTPVVASNNSSLPEATGSAALLVDAEDMEGLADAMARVLGDAVSRAGCPTWGGPGRASPGAAQQKPCCKPTRRRQAERWPIGELRCAGRHLCTGCRFCYYGCSPGSDTLARGCRIGLPGWSSPA